MLKTPHEPKMLWRTPAGFAASHCMNCKAGWTRTGPSGGMLTVCLLDREPVLAEMANCDRFESRQEPEAG